MKTPLAGSCPARGVVAEVEFRVGSFSAQALAEAVSPVAAVVRCFSPALVSM